jgi:acyl-ACP thioesterase
VQLENGRYRDSVALNSHEVDSNNSAHASCYFQVMQEAAGSHAYHLGVSIPQLMQVHKTWVVTRTRMTILRHASWPGTITVETWPQEPWKLYYPRVCRAWDAQDNLLFESLSQWVIMDLATQRPVKPQQTPDLFGGTAVAQVVDPDLGRRVSFDQEAYARLLTHEPRIRYEDCDLNMHVNNVVYLQWMLDSLPFDFRDSHLVREVDISYLAQTFREDRVMVTTGLERPESLTEREPVLFHEISRHASDGNMVTVCVARTRWRNRAQ